MKTPTRNLLPPLVTALLALWLGGCAGTFQGVKAVHPVAPPKERPPSLAVGELRVADERLSEPERQIFAKAVENGIRRWCLEHPGLPALAAGAPIPAEAVVLTGTVTQVDKGSTAARLWIGMGAGKAKVQGDFVVRRPDGTELSRFQLHKSYLGGAGIGGWDMLSMDELATRLGGLAAETTDKWLRGEKLP